MKLTPIALVALLAVAGLGSARSASAAEEPLDFIHALEEKGYADVAADYLTDLKNTKGLSDEDSEVFDFEMSLCMRSAAKQAYNPADRERLMEKSKEYLNKFIEEHPNHSKAIEAVAWLAGFSTDEAMKRLQAASDPKISKEDKDTALAAARKAFEEAQPKFVQAAEKFTQQWKETRTGTRRERELKAEWKAKRDEAFFRSVLCTYYIAQTYEDPKDPKRRELLEKAARQFDDVYQANRNFIDERLFIALTAHMWQAKAVIEIGEDMELATDILDEVLAPFELDEKYITPDTGGLYAQAKQLRLELMAKESIKDFIREARTWRAAFRTAGGGTGTGRMRSFQLDQTEGFQRISLDLAKALLAQADKAASAEKTRLLSEVKKIVDEMVNVSSPYQDEAIALRRKLRGGSDSAPSGFEDACDRGDDALKAKQWEDAVKFYKKALEYATRPKQDQVKISKVNDMIGWTYFSWGIEQFNAGNFPECLDKLHTLLTEYGKSEAAPTGAALVVTTKLNQYLAIPPNQVKKKAEALKDMIESAEYTIHTWPDKPAADDARMSLGQVYFYNGEIDKALKQFDAVNPKAERYPMARHLAAQTYCQRYLREKEKPKATRNEAAMNADREQAMKALKTSVQLQEEKWVKTDPMPAPLIETKLLLAELLLEGGDAKAAAAQFQPLIDAVDKSKPKSLNETMLRIFRGAVRAYVEINDLEKAELAGMVLIDLGPDVEYVNDALLRFARLLEKKRKEAEAAVIAAVVPAEVTAAKNRVAAMNQLLGKLLMKLASRNNVSPVGMVWIAETSSAVGQDQAAEMQCQRFLKLIQSNPAFRKIAGPNAPTRIRTLLVHILGKTGQFQAALEQVTKLIAEHPTALEPRLEECRLRHSWAEQDPDQVLGAQRVSEALRTSLDRITGKETVGILRGRLHRGRLLSHAGRHARQESLTRPRRPRPRRRGSRSSEPPCSASLISMVRTGLRSTATCSANSTGCKVGLRPARSLKNRRGGRRRGHEPRAYARGPPRGRNCKRTVRPMVDPSSIPARLPASAFFLHGAFTPSLGRVK